MSYALGAIPVTSSPNLDPVTVQQLPDLVSVAQRPRPEWLLYLLVGGFAYYLLASGKAGRRRSLW